MSHMNETRHTRGEDRPAYLGSENLKVKPLVANSSDEGRENISDTTSATAYKHIH